MKYSLNVIDNADAYLGLNKTQLQALVFQSYIVRGLSIASFLATLLVDRENLLLLAFSFFFLILSFAVTMALIQNKASEAALYQSVTYGGNCELNRLSELHNEDPEVRRFLKDIRKNGREPLLSELIRLKSYLAEKANGERVSPRIAGLEFQKNNLGSSKTL
jgi:hypothetical protein